MSNARIPQTLKNGEVTYDSRLTRIRQFDRRSRAYPVRAVIADNKKPRSYTWSCGKHLDQGREGACVGFSLAHELIAKPAVYKNIAAADALNFYHQAQQQDPWPGGAYPGASPFYEGTSVLAGAQVMKQRGYLKEYRWAFGLDDLILGVGYKGPAVLGVDWYDNMFDTDKNGYIHAYGEVSGGHAILCKGVNVKQQYFTLHNSWGPDWGVNGDCKISFDDMDWLLHNGGEACIPVTRNSPSLFQDLVDSLKDLF